MKKLLLMMSLLMLGLSGCYVVPHRGHDDGYRGDGGYRGDRDYRHDNDRGRDGYR